MLRRKVLGGLVNLGAQEQAFMLSTCHYSMRVKSLSVDLALLILLLCKVEEEDLGSIMDQQT